MLSNGELQTFCENSYVTFQFCRSSCEGHRTKALAHTLPDFNPFVGIFIRLKLQDQSRILNCELNCNKSCRTHSSATNCNVSQVDITEVISFVFTSPHPANDISPHLHERIRTQHHTVESSRVVFISAQTNLAVFVITVHTLYKNIYPSP